MKHSSRVISIVMMVCIAMCALFVSTGCAVMQQSNDDAKAKQELRDFMGQTNVIMGELDEQLAGFADTVSKQDVVGMKSKVASIGKTLDKIDKLEAPEALPELKTSYSEGCKELQSALDQYVVLYSEIKASTDKHPFNYSKLPERLSEIQKTYQAGYDKLKAADEASAK